MIPCLTDYESESEDEDENSFKALLTTFTDSSATSGFSLTPSDLNIRMGKNGTVWSSFSSPHGRIRSHNTTNTRFHGVRASDIYTPKDAFQIFFSENIVEEIMLCTNLQGDGSLRNGMLYKKTNSELSLAFHSFSLSFLFLAGAEKNWDADVRQLFLDHKLNPTYKASFGVNRFENMQCNLQFDDKRTRVERLKQDKLAAFSYIWGLFIEKFKTQFSVLILYNRRTTCAIQRALSLSAIHAKQTCQVRHQNLLAV